jgi:hypothetical protein
VSRINESACAREVVVSRSLEAERSLLQPVVNGRQAKKTILNPMALFFDELLIRPLFN